MDLGSFLHDILDNFGTTKGWDKKIKNVAKSVLILSVSIGIIAYSFYQIGQMKKEQFEQAAKALIGIAAGLFVMQVLLSQFGKGATVGSAASLLAFAISIKIVVSAINDIVKMIEQFGYNSDDAATVIDALTGVLLALLGSAFVLALINKKIGGFGGIENAGSLLLFTLSLKLVVSSITDLTKIKITDTESFLWALTGVFVALMGVAVVAYAAGGMSFGAGIGVLALVLSLKLLIGVINDIATKVDPKAILNNIGGFIAVFGIIIVLLGMTRIAGEHAAAAGIGLLATAIAFRLMINVITLLGTMDPKVAMTGIFMLIPLWAMMVGLLLVVGVAGQYAIQAGVAMVLVSLALTLMVVPIFLLGSMDASTAFKGVIAVIILMDGIAAMLIATGAAGEHAVTGAIAIVLITLCISALTYAVWMLSEIDDCYRRIDGAFKIYSKFIDVWNNRYLRSYRNASTSAYGFNIRC